MTSRSDRLTHRTPDGVLAFFLRDILFRLRYTSHEVHRNIDEYLTRKNIRSNLKRHHKRSQLQEDIRSKQITIKTFFRVLDVFQVTNLRFSVQLEFMAGHTYEFSKTYTIRNNEENAPHLFHDVAKGLIEYFESHPDFKSLSKGFGETWRKIRAQLDSPKMTIKIFMRCMEFLRVNDFVFKFRVESMTQEPFEIEQKFFLQYQINTDEKTNAKT